MMFDRGTMIATPSEFVLRAAGALVLLGLLFWGLTGRWKK